MTRKALLILVSLGASLCAAQNPFITHMYTADPSARVFGDTLYVYPSHDEDTATRFSMQDWHVFSTTDMEHWTDHGVAFSLQDIRWADSRAWAPDCIERNGKYYFYYPVEASKIGVAVGDTPRGPFRDPLDSALIHTRSEGVVCDRDFIDPCVFIDDDGQAYLYMGQLVVNAIRLNEDMISYDGEVHLLEGTDDFFEAVWMHKYRGKYYLSYAAVSGEIKYCMSDHPLGPFEYKGVILQKMNSGTNHHSIVEYKGQWYLFYHNSDLYYRKHPEAEYRFGWGHRGSPHPFRRSICFDRLHYNEDGTIAQVIPTMDPHPEMDLLSTARNLEEVNVSFSKASYDGKTCLKVNPDPVNTEARFLKLNDWEFHNGVIEMDVMGKRAADAGEGARGFVGIAFRVEEDNSRFECFYIRPTNGRAEDQLRRNHSVQYVSYPDFPWYTLRSETPGMYESYSDLVEGAWTHLKIVVRNDRAKLYVGGAEQATLLVNDLKLGADTSGKIGLWVGPGTEACFAHLSVAAQ